MNLFWKNLLGGMMSTAKIEAKYNALLADYKRYKFIEQSKELEEYQHLYEQVKSPEFRENKKMLLSRKYKDTQEYRDLKKFRKLDNNFNINHYYETLESAELKDFLAFKKTPEYRLLGKKNELKKSEELRRYKKFEKSKRYKNYMRFHSSYIISEYERLKAKVSTKEFIDANDFWADRNRWERTEDFHTERRYLELSANIDIIFYKKTDPKPFEILNKYTSTFTENFDWNTMNASKWNSGFFYKQKELIGNYSLTSEKQGNNNGNNTFVSEGILNVVMRKEPIETRAWDAKLGFVNHHFDYMGDVLHGANAISQQYGVFRAKMRFKGRGISHAFWLTGDSKLPIINICKCNGKTLEVGVYWKTKFENQYTSRKITGINFGSFFIYSLVWTKRELVWYINNVEVFRTSNGVPSEPMFPMLSSYITAKQKGGEGFMEVDWIKFYSNCD